MLSNLRCNASQAKMTMNLKGSQKSAVLVARQPKFSIQKIDKLQVADACLKVKVAAYFNA